MISTSTTISLKAYTTYRHVTESCFGGYFTREPSIPMMFTDFFLGFSVCIQVQASVSVHIWVSPRFFIHGAYVAGVWKRRHASRGCHTYYFMQLISHRSIFYHLTRIICMFYTKILTIASPLMSEHLIFPFKLRRFNQVADSKHFLSLATAVIRWQDLTPNQSSLF